MIIRPSSLRRLGASLCFLVLAVQGAWAVDVGALAPDLVLSEERGTSSLAQLRGRVVYLDFWASWCGPCRQSFPVMNQLQAKFRGQGLDIVAVNLDARRTDAQAFLAEVPAQFRIAFDAAGSSAKLFGVQGMPSSYLIGRDGRVIAVHQGFRDEDRASIEKGIAQALAAK